jgi:hypothetical protein
MAENHRRIDPARLAHLVGTDLLPRHRRYQSEAAALYCKSGPAADSGTAGRLSL